MRRSLLLILGLAMSGVSAFAQPRAASLPQPPDVAAVKRMFDPWRAPVPPKHLVANIYYVGAIGVSSYLFTTPEGHILLDTGFEDTVPLITKSVTELGFKMSDIKIIISSHAHIDHVGGHAAMKKLTGAKIVASAADARTIESGGHDDFIQFPPETILYTPVKVDRIVGEGDTVSLGGTTLTAHMTPGHTRGATTWTMTVNDEGQTRNVVFFSSASINDGTRLLHNAAYPQIVEDLTATFAKLKALPCDYFFAPHGGQFAMGTKFARLDAGEKPNPFIDPAGYKKTVGDMEQSFLGLLAREKALEPKK